MFFPLNFKIQGWENCKGTLSQITFSKLFCKVIENPHFQEESKTNINLWIFLSIFWHLYQTLLPWHSPAVLAKTGRLRMLKKQRVSLHFLLQHLPKHSFWTNFFSGSHTYRGKRYGGSHKAT